MPKTKPRPERAGVFFRGQGVTKLQDGERHAAVRLFQRYGMVLTEDLKTYIAREIGRALKQRKRRFKKERPSNERARPAKAFYLSTNKSDPRNAKWRVEVDGVHLIVVYDSTSKVIVTFLPRGEAR
jgi:hypothetical protein